MCASLADHEKFLQCENIWWQKSASVQPRTALQNRAARAGERARRGTRARGREQHVEAATGEARAPEFLQNLNDMFESDVKKAVI